MINQLAANLVKLKKDFVNTYFGNSNIQEVIPLTTSDLFPINEKHLKLLHHFASKNPIYYNSYEEKISNLPCIVYEGDINEYWLNSIQHNTSLAPFSPTWIFSAYLCALCAKNLGCKEIVDIGSGDGRIAYCGKVLDLDSFSIELDDTLVDLQKLICKKTKLDFQPFCADAITFDYSKFQLTTPAFFIGGLAQMGGASLANGVLKKINSISNLKENSCMVFAGTNSEKYSPDPKSVSGWGTILYENNLTILDTISLPTAWTINEPEDTPYIFSKSK